MKRMDGQILTESLTSSTTVTPDWLELGDIPKEAQPPKLVVHSSASWFGIWNFATQFQPMDYTLKSDGAEALLTEAFFLGWNFGQDWYPLVQSLTRQVFHDWASGRRHGLLIPNYSPKWFWKQVLEGTRMYRIHETAESRAKENATLQTLCEHVPGTTIAQTKEFCTWDGILMKSTTPLAVVELKTRNYSKSFFDKHGLILTKKKFDGLHSIATTYKIAGLLLLKCNDGLYVLNVRSVDRTKLVERRALNDRWDVPTDEDVVVIPGGWFVSVVRTKELVNV